ncbi:hypothetical protein ACQKJG_18840 [Priestia megaterium]|uniref:hypothetical protein n=1 Tax=Priestia megaterium TaxID=1404 RepID=UPI003D01528C
MVMDNTRFEIAKMLKEYWSLLNWKGDDHTNGIYFYENYAYLVERTYAMRMEHSEPAASLFYVPAEASETEEDEVLVTYPYENMTKKPNKFQLLFKGSSLLQEELNQLFEVEGEAVEVEVQPLLDLLKTIPKKRERDRSWFMFEAKGNEITASLFHKENETAIKLPVLNECKGDVTMSFMVNANNLYHALNVISFARTISIMKSHDKIKLTRDTSQSRLGAVISLPKETIEREIKIKFRKE